VREGVLVKTALQLLGLAVGVWVAVYSVNPPEVYAQTIQVIRADGGFIGTASNKIQCLSSMECGISRGAVTLWADAGSGGATPSSVCGDGGSALGWDGGAFTCVPTVYGPELLPNESTTPAAPATGFTKLFAYGVGPSDFGIPHIINEDGMVLPLWAPFPDTRCFLDGPAGTGTVLGLEVTGFGTGAVGAIANTNLITWRTRVTHTTAAGANSAAGLRSTATINMTQGNAAGIGGFIWGSRSAITTNINTQKIFIGLQNVAGAPGVGDPDSLTNTIYIGADAADANLEVCSNDGSGTATCNTLGANFPKGGTLLYDVYLYSPTNGSTVGYFIKNVGSGNIASGTISSDLPANTNFFAWYVWINNGATGGAAVNVTMATCVWTP
jgi:hypothetical protein